MYVFLEYRNRQFSGISETIMNYFINDTTTKIITKTIFSIHDTIEDFLITAKNQIITIGDKSLKMCRIPDETGRVSKIMKRDLIIDLYINRIKLNDEG